MAIASRKFQAPKGTRDFYPQDMAVRRYIEGVWRQLSINHGFDEVDGPTFENLDLYTYKSGPGIVSEIFQVFSGKDEEQLAAIRGGASAPFALRPEFTPTLARMVAAKASELPRPIKWFAIPTHFRAERPQRGRLREFLQWNVDFIGSEDSREARAQADVELLACVIECLRSVNLTSDQVRIRLSNRSALSRLMVERLDVAEDQVDPLFILLDRRGKQSPHEFRKTFSNNASALGLSEDAVTTLMNTTELRVPATASWSNICNSLATPFGRLNSPTDQSRYFDELELIHKFINAHALQDFIVYDFSIVRGLAYYTGTVFEVYETTGAERAIAGGGRYDKLIESFGGPSLPACGFGMGDVVLANILHDKGLLPEEVYMKPLRPHAFAIAASDEAEAKMRNIVAQLRRDGFHVRHSYKTTRNVGKLLGEASRSRALSAIIFGKDIADDRVDFKDLQSGDQQTLAISDIQAKLKNLISQYK